MRLIKLNELWIFCIAALLINPSMKLLWVTWALSLTRVICEQHPEMLSSSLNHSCLKMTEAKVRIIPVNICNKILILW